MNKSMLPNSPNASIRDAHRMTQKEETFSERVQRAAESASLSRPPKSETFSGSSMLTLDEKTTQKMLVDLQSAMKEKETKTVQRLCEADKLLALLRETEDGNVSRDAVVTPMSTRVDVPNGSQANESTVDENGKPPSAKTQESAALIMAQSSSAVSNVSPIRVSSPKSSSPTPVGNCASGIQATATVEAVTNTVNNNSVPPVKLRTAAQQLEDMMRPSSENLQEASNSARKGRNTLVEAHGLMLHSQKLVEQQMAMRNIKEQTGDDAILARLLQQS